MDNHLLRNGDKLMIRVGCPDEATILVVIARLQFQN